MIGSRKLAGAVTQRILKGVVRDPRIAAARVIERQSSLLPCVRREFADKKEESKEIKAEETGGYYWEKFGINKNDPFYDPFNPYVWMHVLPRRLQPYLRFMRIDQNFGRMLVVSPHLWGIAIASTLGGFPDLINLFWFGTGGLFAHACACAFDDIADVDIDRQNVRTQRRPLVAEIMSKTAGVTIVMGLAASSFGILSMLTPTAINVGLLCTPCIIAYPFIKRFFQYPQVFLAFALNLGVFFGYGAVASYLSWPVVIPLYIAGVAHTIFYDSIYAFQDIEADTNSGTYSTSQKFAKHAKGIMTGLAITTVGLHSVAGIAAGLHPSFLALIAAGSTHLVWQIRKLDVKNAPLCDHLLNISYRYGIFVLCAYMIGVFFAKKKRKQVEEQLKKSMAPPISN